MRLLTEKHAVAQSAIPSPCAAAVVSPPAYALPCPAHTVGSAWSNTHTHTKEHISLTFFKTYQAFH